MGKSLGESPPGGGGGGERGVRWVDGTVGLEVKGRLERRGAQIRGWSCYKVSCWLVMNCLFEDGGM